MPDRNEIDRSAAADSAGGDAWYDRHIDKFRTAIVRPDARPEDLAFYDAAIGAKMTEHLMAALRIDVRNAGRAISANVPPEPARGGGEKLLATVRPVVLTEDAAAENVAFYEAIVAANTLREFSGTTHSRVVDAAQTAGAL